MPTAIDISDLRFGYGKGPDVLDIPTFSVAPSESVFLHGASGSGKSTLLSLIGGVMLPRSGSVEVLGNDLGALRNARRDRVRADHIGFIFQQFNLLPYLSVDENVGLPCRYSARRRQRAVEADGSVAKAIDRLLGDLGIGSDLRGRRATELSVGQQQRVAAARALVGRPELIVADEPTSALDTDRRREFIDLLLNECRQVGSAMVFVSHDLSLATHFDRSVELQSANEAGAHTDE